MGCGAGFTVLRFRLVLTAGFIRSDVDDSSVVRKYVRPVDRVVVAVTQQLVLLIQHASAYDLCQSKPQDTTADMQHASHPSVHYSCCCCCCTRC